MTIGLPEDDGKRALTPPVEKAGVLVVDDDPAFQLGLKTFLREYAGFGKVHTARSGYEALNILEANENITVVTLDNEMPGMSGIELLGKLSESETDPVSVVMITGKSTDDLESRFKGFKTSSLITNHYLAKPVSFEELEPVILRAHDERAAHCRIDETISEVTGDNHPSEEEELNEEQVEEESVEAHQETGPAEEEQDELFTGERKSSFAAEETDSEEEGDDEVTDEPESDDHEPQFGLAGLPIIDPDVDDSSGISEEEIYVEDQVDEDDLEKVEAGFLDNVPETDRLSALEKKLEENTAALRELKGRMPTIEQRFWLGILKLLALGVILWLMWQMNLFSHAENLWNKWKPPLLKANAEEVQTSAKSNLVTEPVSNPQKEPNSKPEPKAAKQKEPEPKGQKQESVVAKEKPKKNDSNTDDRNAKPVKTEPKEKEAKAPDPEAEKEQPKKKEEATENSEEESPKQDKADTAKDTWYRGILLTKDVERLESEGKWEEAKGKNTEAIAIFERVRVEFPDFEQEIVELRLQQMRNKQRQIDARLRALNQRRQAIQ